MMLGMALYKWGFLDGRRATRDIGDGAAIWLPLGLALAWIGIVALERVRFRMPDRTSPISGITPAPSSRRRLRAR